MIICYGLPPVSDPTCAVQPFFLGWELIHLHCCDMHAKRLPLQEIADFFFLYSLPSFSLSPFHIEYVLFQLFPFCCASCIDLSHSNKPSEISQMHTQTHSAYLSLAFIYFFFFDFPLFRVCGCRIPVSATSVIQIPSGCGCEHCGGSHSDIWP